MVVYYIHVVKGAMKLFAERNEFVHGESNPVVAPIFVLD